MTFAAFTAFGSTLELTAAERPTDSHPNDPIEIWAHEPGETVGFNLARLHPGSGRFEPDDSAIRTTVQSLSARHKGGGVTRTALAVARGVFVIARLPLAVFLPAARTTAQAASGVAIVSRGSGGSASLILILVGLLLLLTALYVASMVLVVLSPLLITAGFAKTWLSISQRSVSRLLKQAAQQVATAAAQGTVPSAVTATAKGPSGLAVAGVFVVTALCLWGPYAFKRGQTAPPGPSVSTLAPATVPGASEAPAPR